MHLVHHSFRSIPLTDDFSITPEVCLQADMRPSLAMALGRAGPPPAPTTSAVQLQLPTGCLGAAALNVMRYVPEVRKHPGNEGCLADLPP